jgi:uncharacterized protein (UPF0333 family)
MTLMLRFFLSKKGVTSEVFKLALAIIIIAAILAILAPMLSSVSDASGDSVNATVDALGNLSEALRQKVSVF